VTARLHVIAAVLLLLAPAAHSAVSMLIEHRAPNGSISKQNCTVAAMNVNGTQARVLCTDRIFLGSFER
jgi:hypothetical protein